MNLELLSVSNADILPVSEMSAFLRVDDPTQASLIQSLVKASITTFQEYTGRQLLTASYKLTKRNFPRYRRDRGAGHPQAILIPKPPFVSITSVGYYATAGTLTYLTETTNYQIVKGELFRELWPAPGTAWPFVQPGLANGVEVVFTCGYGITRASIDEQLIHSLKVLSAHWYENRETGDIPDFVLNLWQQWSTGEQA